VRGQDQDLVARRDDRPDDRGEPRRPAPRHENVRPLEGDSGPGAEPVDDGASVAGGGGAAGSSAAGGAQGAASTGTVDATQPAGQTAPATPVDAAKEAMKKGGKLLKGILGGGT